MMHCPERENPIILTPSITNVTQMKSSVSVKCDCVGERTKGKNAAVFTCGVLKTCIKFQTA